MTSNRQHGAILIIVLWFVVLAAVLVGTIASEIRLSAKAVFHNKAALQVQADRLKAIHIAEMELLIARMPLPPDDEEYKKNPDDRHDRFYQFNGQPLATSYAAPENMEIRVYDHAGRINFQLLNSQQRRQILQRLIGADDTDSLDTDTIEQLNSLEDAWQDWIDTDDLKRPNGAEKDEYEEKKPPYTARNGPLETVQEILLIEGFAEVFKGINLDAALSMYNSSQSINPNVATREALMLLPGMTSTLADLILTLRREKDFNDQRLAEFSRDYVEPERWNRLRPWLSFNKSNFYTIAVRKKTPEEVAESEIVPDAEKSDEATSPSPANTENQRAYMVTVQVQGFTNEPESLIVQPYGTLPDQHHDTLPVPDVPKFGGRE